MTERTAGRRLPAAWAEVLGELALTAAAVALALLAGAALLALAGYDVRDAYYNLWDGAFGSVYSVADTLVNAMPLLFAGLAVAFAFRGGLFNIGAEGQLYAGALATAVTAAALAEWPSVPSHRRGHAGGSAGRRAVGPGAGRAQSENRRPRSHYHHHAQLRGHPFDNAPGQTVFQSAGAGGSDGPHPRPRPAAGTHRRHPPDVGRRHRRGAGGRGGLAAAPHVFRFRRGAGRIQSRRGGVRRRAGGRAHGVDHGRQRRRGGSGRQHHGAGRAVPLHRQLFPRLRLHRRRGGAGGPGPAVGRFARGGAVRRPAGGRPDDAAVRPHSGGLDDRGAGTGDSVRRGTGTFVHVAPAARRGAEGRDGDDDDGGDGGRGGRGNRRRADNETARREAGP